MKIYKNFLLSGSYQLLIIILPIITAPYISRTLGVEGVGIYTFTGSVVQYFVMFATLGTATYGNREIAYNQKNKKSRSKIFWGINFLSWITATISLIAFGIFTLLNNKYQLIYFWQGFLILANMFDISWYFMGMEKFKVTVTRNFIFKIISVVCIFTFVRNSNNLSIYVAIMSLGTLIGNLSLWPYLKKEIEKPHLEDLNLKRHLKFTLVLFLPTIAVQIYLVANKTMIGVLDSIVDAGIFYQADMVIKMALSLIGAIGVVMLPRVSSMHSEGDIEGIQKTIIKCFNIVTGISVAMFFGISAIAIKFGPFFFGNSFELVGLIMMIESPIIIFISWSSVLGTQYLLPTNRMKPFTISVTLGAILNIALNLILIPYYGVIGATIATVFAEFSVTAYQYYSVRKEFPLKTLVSGTWKYFVSGLLMFVVVFSLNQKNIMTVSQLLTQVIAGGIIYLFSNILLKSDLWKMAKQIVLKKRM